MNDRKIEGLEKTEKRTTMYPQIGSIGLERYGGYIMEEFLTNLRMPQCLKVYREMASNDATIGGVLFLLESMMRKLPYNVEAGGDKRVDKNMKLHVEQCMDDMEHSWLDLIVEALSMWIYGFSWHEIVYKKRTIKNSKYPDGRIGWAKIPIRSQNSWNRWVYDEVDPDKLTGMEQLAPNVNKLVVIPYEKSLLFRTKLYRNSPEGVSMLRNAYRAWYFKKRIEELEGIGIERDLAGLPVMSVPADVDIWNKDNPEAVVLKADLERMVSNIRRDKSEGVLKPETYTLELLSSNSSRQFDTSAIINRWDQRVAMTMLSDLILMGTEKTGSFALAKEKKNLLAASLEAMADNILNIINTVAIPKLIKLNTFNGYTEYPKITRGEIEIPDMVKLADAMERFVKMGMKFMPDEKTEKYLRECLGLPTLSDEEKKKLEIEGQKLIDDAQKKENKLKPRQYEEHQTDDKGEFNDTYEEAGMKKFFKKLFGIKKEDDKK